MKLNTLYSLPQTLAPSFQELINIYNNQETGAVVKTQSLEKINALWHDFSKKTSYCKEVAQEVINLLQEVKVQSNDINLWIQLIGEIKKVSPTITKLLPKDPITLLPDELYLLIVEELDNMEDIDSLAQTNQRLHSLLSNPKFLAHFLDKFSSSLTPTKRYTLALRCGEVLTQLSLLFSKVR